jgi:hypothetical protein
MNIHQPSRFWRWRVHKFATSWMYMFGVLDVDTYMCICVDNVGWRIILFPCVRLVWIDGKVKCCVTCFYIYTYVHVYGVIQQTISTNIYIYTLYLYVYMYISICIYDLCVHIHCIYWHTNSYVFVHIYICVYLVIWT